MARSTPQAILLVDGYNIIGAWNSLKQTRDRLGLEEARRELVHALMGYSSFQGYHTQVVFDAQYQDTPGSREIINSSVMICYTDFKQTADSYIEKACALFRQDLRKFEQRLIVATSDRAQQLTVVGYGAEWMSAHKLQVEVEMAELRVSRRRQQEQKKNGRSAQRFLFNAIDPEARQRLSKLRDGEDKEL
ncbi:MAG: NYN domain-containing protein [Oculatellaceae cyanobacterium Prado106]|jgi:hypothetical protein|nr:NYN domain-containing protein [Oculatellaceae cyanobacterium Prado106]